MEKDYKMGVVKATSLVAGNMIGSGVLLAPALLAPYGSMSLVGWILTTVGALALALVFSKLSVWIPKAGGPYTFVKHVFGDFIGFQMAWGYWISAWCGSVSLLSGTLQYTSIFCPQITSSASLSIGLGCSMIWLFTFFNIRGVKESTFVEVIIVIIKILPLVLIAIAGIFFVDFSKVFNAEDVKTHGLSSLGAMSGVLLWAFIGLESATVPSDQVKNPTRTIPIATIAGVLITAAVYVLGAIVITGVIPHNELITSKAPYVDAAVKIFGNVGGTIMIITGIIGIAGSLNGWILIQGQVPFAAAKEAIFPKIFTKTNKHGTPIGVIIGSVLMTLLFVLTYQPSIVKHIEFLINVAVLAMLLPYFYSAAAFVFLAFKGKMKLSCWQKIYTVIVSSISLLYTFLAIILSGEKLIFITFTLFLISVPIYCLTKNENC